MSQQGHAQPDPDNWGVSQNNLLRGLFLTYNKQVFYSLNFTHPGLGGMGGGSSSGECGDWCEWGGSGEDTLPDGVGETALVTWTGW